MLKTLFLSDLHFEFHPDRGKTFVKLLPEADVVVLAGDICTQSLIEDTADMFCDKFPHVVQVTGNHEYYHSSWNRVEGAFAAATAKHENLHYLNKTIAVIEGQRFIGATMWFPQKKNNAKWDMAKWGMTDFHLIQDFEKWVYRESEEAAAFIIANAGPLDVVVTHHLPSYQCVAPQFVGSPLNAFFVRDMHKAIEKYQPRIWAFGHTHTSVDSKIGATRLLCNPFGYYGHEVNTAFKADMFVELSNPVVDLADKILSAYEEIPEEGWAVIEKDFEWEKDK